MVRYYEIRDRFDEKDLNQLISFESKTSTQINALKNLAELFKKDPAINEMMKNKSHEQLKKMIDRNPVIKQELNNYFLEFGGRFANELKLESPDLEEDYTQLFHILNQYQNIDFNTSKSIHNKKSKSWILKQFKKYATQREEFRLLRSNSFSLVRKLFNRIGEVFQEENRIENTEDIYYLEIEEILEEKKSYKNLISERKIKYINYKNIEIPSFFGMTNGVMPDFETEKDEQRFISAIKDNYFKNWHKEYVHTTLLYKYKNEYHACPLMFKPLSKSPKQMPDLAYIMVKQDLRLVHEQKYYIND